jgi:hypothetical protein
MAISLEFLADKVGCLFGCRPIVRGDVVCCDRCRRQLVGIKLVDLTSTDETCKLDGGK